MQCSSAAGVGGERVAQTTAVAAAAGAAQRCGWRHRRAGHRLTQSGHCHAPATAAAPAPTAPAPVPTSTSTPAAVRAPVRCVHVQVVGQL